MIQQFLTVFFLAILLLFSACSTLPEYAKPTFHATEDNAPVLKNGFGYRKLTIADFKADSLPTTYEQYHHNIQARSCISIRPAKETRIRITNNVLGGQEVYMGSYSKISFEAVFNPECSWWNPHVPGRKKSYVLQHEQIHFALTELSARRMNRQYREGLEQYLAIGKSFKEVQNELLEIVRSVSREVLEADIVKHTAFDEETSLYYDREVQQKWFDTVRRRLIAPEG
ncbi:hypothetical protein [Desulfosediminicola flagellatus]|uniref:hypothetical protein n=1 Tax=Desulfosediminicola flagellatus TaxID=2569541 RepID=UPI0010AD4192|nr:hypothetical protein [Desulfosediminicola flagellatus]